MAAARTALNIAWDTDAKRPFVRGKAVGLALVGGVFPITGATLGFTVVASIIRRRGRPPATAAARPGAADRGGHVAGPGRRLHCAAVRHLRLPVPLVPAVPTRMSGIWPGALAAAAGFEALQYGFSAYLAFFGHYNKACGSLGAVVAFMFFVCLACMVFLFGAEIASEHPRLRGGAPGAEGGGHSPHTSRHD